MAALRYLESQRNAQPELSDWYNSLADLYQRKLWHQLTLKLDQFVALAVFQDLAFDLSCSALLGHNIYNFGELLAHPIIKSLLGTKVEWLYHILQSFNTGDLVRYKELCLVHRAALSAQPALVENENRTIPLDVIAEPTKLSIVDVEYLLIKSLSVTHEIIMRRLGAK